MLEKQSTAAAMETDDAEDGRQFAFAYAAIFWLSWFAAPQSFGEDSGFGSGLLASVTHFIQTSSRGEFEIRLELLSGFLREALRKCYAAEDEVEQRRWHEQACVLFNTIGYFREFLPLLQQRLAQERAPIQASLKDMVQPCDPALNRIAEWRIGKISAMEG